MRLVPEKTARMNEIVSTLILAPPQKKTWCLKVKKKRFPNLLNQFFMGLLTVYLLLDL